MPKKTADSTRAHPRPARAIHAIHSQGMHPAVVTTIPSTSPGTPERMSPDGWSQRAVSRPPRTAVSAAPTSIAAAAHFTAAGALGPATGPDADDGRSPGPGDRVAGCVMAALLALKPVSPCPDHGRASD